VAAHVVFQAQGVVAENPKHMDLDFAMLLSVFVPCMDMVLNKTAGPDL
jgi:hypothetical protein